MKAYSRDRSAYAEKLKDPRWQRKRLSVMERDHWRCRICGDKDTTLNVHHLYYEGEPWEVPDDALLTVCAPCHEEETATRYQTERRLIKAVRRFGLSNEEVDWFSDRLELFAEMLGEHRKVYIENPGDDPDTDPAIPKESPLLAAFDAFLLNPHAWEFAASSIEELGEPAGPVAAWYLGLTSMFRRVSELVRKRPRL